MTGAYISPVLRQGISEQARHRCGYCLRSEELMGMILTIDHIIPQAKGGSSEEDNLWLACPSRNQFKGAQTHAPDPESGTTLALFNPRTQAWTQHFAWNDDGTRIIGVTPCGRATLDALRINNPEIVVARRMWVSAGWWPPMD